MTANITLFPKYLSHLSIILTSISIPETLHSPMFYRRSVNQECELVDHASRLGITLKSSGLMYKSPRKGSPRATSATLSTKSQRGINRQCMFTPSPSFPTPTYIQDVVVPVNNAIYMLQCLHVLMAACS